MRNIIVLRQLAFSPLTWLAIAIVLARGTLLRAWKRREKSPSSAALEEELSLDPKNPDYENNTSSAEFPKLSDGNLGQKPLIEKTPSSCPAYVIILPDFSHGLKHDSEIFSKYFGAEPVLMTEPPPVVKHVGCSIWIHLELMPHQLVKGGRTDIHPGYLSSKAPPGTLVWLMANADQFYPEQVFVGQSRESVLTPNGQHVSAMMEPDLILCKTQQCIQWITEQRRRIQEEKLHQIQVESRLLYIGFTSSDPIQRLPSPEDSTLSPPEGNHQLPPLSSYGNHQFLHIAGKSPHKGTTEVIAAWQPHKLGLSADQVSLTLTSYNNSRLDYFRVIQERNRQPTDHHHRWPASDNLKHVDTKLSQSDFVQLMWDNAIHICISSMEGFGHSLNEARAMGAMIVATDAPPMNEFFSSSPQGKEESGDDNSDETFGDTTSSRSSSAILIAPSQFLTWTNGLTYAHVDATDLARSVRFIVEDMSFEDRMKMGRQARKSYEEDQETFTKRMAHLQACMDTLGRVADPSERQQANSLGVCSGFQWFECMKECGLELI